MFCKHCGRQLLDEEKFCPDCGTPSTPNTQPPVPQPEMPRQMTQDTAPLPQLSNMESANGKGLQPGQQPPGTGSTKKLYYVLGIAAGLLILAAGAFVLDHFLWQRQMETSAQTNTVTMTEEEMKARGMVLRSKYAAKGQQQAQQDKGQQTQQDSAAKKEQAQTTSASQNKQANKTTPSQKQPQETPSPQDPIRANKALGHVPVRNKMDDAQLHQTLQMMQGSWYDDRGGKAVTISQGRINGCTAVALYDVAGGGGHAAGTFRLKENGSEWDVRLSWEIRGTTGDSLTVNGGQSFYRK